MKIILKGLAGMLAVAGIIAMSLMGARMMFWLSWHILKFLFLVYSWVFGLLALGYVISKIFKK